MAYKVVLQSFVAQMHKNLMMVKEQRNRRIEETDFDSAPVEKPENCNAQNWWLTDNDKL